MNAVHGSDIVFDNLSFSQFRALFQVTSPVHLPPYTGSTFRGALGHALRDVHYGVKGTACLECSVRSQCRYDDIYAYLFGTPKDHPYIAPVVQSLILKQETYPQPFVLEPPVGGAYPESGLLALGFSLVGKAITMLPFMVCALSLLERRPLGQDTGYVTLRSVVDGFELEHCREGFINGGRSWLTPGQVNLMSFDHILEWRQGILRTNPNPREICIQFSTPFRFKTEHRLGVALTFEVFVRNLLRRLTLLSVHSPLDFEIDCQDLLAKAQHVNVGHSLLQWADWERYSSRQEQRMKLGGLIGEIVFAGSLAEFLPYIKLCEYLHVGKNTAFGLGRFEIVSID